MISVAEINKINEWQDIKTDSTDNYELIVFKYSPICTVSFTGGKILESWSSRLEDKTKLKIVKVDVIKSRELSKFIEKETQIKHESPQIIWFDIKRNIKWHGSHFRISEANLKLNLE